MDYDKDTIEFLPKPTIHNFIDLTGQTFGRLKVLGIIERRKKKVYWLCKCECSTLTKVNGAELRLRHTKSCGCLKFDTQSNFIHGMSKNNAEYRAWASMRSRCTNPNLRQWKDWGGRGIRFCERWNDFQNFYADVGNRPSDNYSFERIDNNAHYSCGKCTECIANGWTANCQWATREKQANNRRNVKRYTYLGRTQTAVDWAKEFHLHPRVLTTRLRLGWALERALTTPKHFQLKTSKQSEIWLLVLLLLIRCPQIKT